MKKLISFVLSIALLISVFCMSVSAANLVGTRGTNGTIEDGLSEGAFNSAHMSDNVVLNVGGTHSRYAVDITFPTTLTFTSSAYIWNVNNLQYEQQADFSLTNTTFDFSITNYSDRSIDVKFAIDDTEQLVNFGGLIEFGAISDISDTWGENADFIADGASTTAGFTGILKGVYAVNENKGNRNPTSIEFDSQMKTQEGQNWADVIGRYMMDSRDSGRSAYTLAKFTVTVSKVTPTP